jgi:hypothetical protein
VIAYLDSSVLACAYLTDEPGLAEAVALLEDADDRDLDQSRGLRRTGSGGAHR